MVDTNSVQIQCDEPMEVNISFMHSLDEAMEETGAL